MEKHRKQMEKDRKKGENIGNKSRKHRKKIGKKSDVHAVPQGSTGSARESGGAKPPEEQGGASPGNTTPGNNTCFLLNNSRFLDFRLMVGPFEPTPQQKIHLGGSVVRSSHLLVEELLAFLKDCRVYREDFAYIL